MPVIGALKSWGTEVLTSTDLNGNFSTIRTTVNTYCAFVDQPATISAVWTYSAVPVFSAGISLGNTLTVTTGGLAVTGNSSITGTLTVSSTVTASGFSGSGASLTALNASQLTSGTVPDARFPATLPVLNGSNLTNLTAGNLTGSLPAISGAALTGLTAAQIAAGTFPGSAYTVQTLNVTTGVRSQSGAYHTTRRDDRGNVTGSMTVTATNGNVQRFRLTGNITSVTLTGFLAGGAVVLDLVQDGTGGRTITWPSTIDWANGSAPTLTTTADRKDRIALELAGARYIGWVIAQNIPNTD